MSNQSKNLVVPVDPKALVSHRFDNSYVPPLIQGAGRKAKQHYLDFFASTISNQNTRNAYRANCDRFLSWCEELGIFALIDIEPWHVGAYLEWLKKIEHKPGETYSIPTVKQNIAAIRMMFNYLVVNQVIAINPGLFTRGPKLSVKKGKTKILSAAEARRLLDSIDLKREVDYRDRALIGLMVFTFARVSAALSCRVSDYFVDRGQRKLRFMEKGSKVHDMPVHALLETYIDQYLEFAGIASDEKGFLFRSSSGRYGKLTGAQFLRQNSYDMVRKRVAAIGITEKIGNHSLRGTGITAYLGNGGLLEHAQEMAAHASPRTTGLYNRNDDSVQIAEIHKIPI